MVGQCKDTKMYAECNNRHYTLLNLIPKDDQPTVNEKSA